MHTKGQFTGEYFFHSFVLGIQEVVGRIEWSIFYYFQMIDE